MADKTTESVVVPEVPEKKEVVAEDKVETKKSPEKKVIEVQTVEDDDDDEVDEVEKDDDEEEEDEEESVKEDKSPSCAIKGNAPWWNHDCSIAVKQRKAASRQMQRHPSAENLIAYKNAKVNARRVLRSARRACCPRIVPVIDSSTSVTQETPKENGTTETNGHSKEEKATNGDSEKRPAEESKESSPVKKVKVVEETEKSSTPETAKEAKA